MAAKQTARAHFLFNLLGSIWPILFFYPFLYVIGLMVPQALNLNFAQLEAFSHPEQAAAAAKEISFHITMFLAAFHTAFNVVNTLLFLPFSNQLAWLSTKLVWGRQTQEGPHLKFLDPKVMNSAPMALHAARREMLRMLEEVELMFNHVLDLISHPSQKMGAVADKILASEEIVDMLEKEISEYLVPVTRLELSTHQSHEVAGILNSVGEIERMGDHCESLLRLARRRYEKALPFGDETMAEIMELGGHVKAFLALLRENMFDASADLMKEAGVLEDTIDAMRKSTRTSHISRIKEQQYGVQEGLIYIDMLTKLEKIGDHAYTVARTFDGER